MSRDLLGFVDSRASQLSIALDSQNEVSLASRHSCQRGFVVDVDRSFLGVFGQRPDLLQIPYQRVVNLSDGGGLAFKMTRRGESFNFGVH